MARCETRGNDHSPPITVTRDGGRRTCDSFECAIHAPAPICERLRHPHTWPRGRERRSRLLRRALCTRRRG